MPTFFVEPAHVDQDRVAVISGEDALHISRSLRMRPGEEITLVCGLGREHRARLERVEPALVLARIFTSEDRHREPAAAIHVVQALPKGPGMAEVCERLTELGAASIWPVVTDRTIPRLDSNKAADRQARWQKVAKEAAQLAHRHAVPQVEAPLPLSAAAARLQSRFPSAQRLVCDAPSATMSLASAPWDPATPTVLLIGPEGGLSPEELESLSSLGFRAVSLGPRNLRTLLAGAVATTILLQRAGDLELRLA